MEKYFSSQQADEEIIMVIRKHWFVLIPAVVMAGIIYLIGFAGIFVIPLIFPAVVEGYAYNVYVVVLSLLFLFNSTYLFSVWLIHYLNVGIITTEHIVEICQDSLFSRKISELGLDRIQDVSASQKGLSATMFNYGEIDVQTAGELPNFLFSNIPDPNETAQKIMELEEEYSGRHGIRKALNGNANISKPEDSTVGPDLPERIESVGPEIEYPSQKDTEV